MAEGQPRQERAGRGWSFARWTLASFPDLHDPQRQQQSAPPSAAALDQQLGALEEAAGKFGWLPNELHVSQFGSVTIATALAQTCKHLRVQHGLELEWLWACRDREAQRLLCAFVHVAGMVTAAELRASFLASPDAAFCLSKEGALILRGRLQGHVWIWPTQTLKLATPTPTGSDVAGKEVDFLSAHVHGRANPAPCCFGRVPLPADQPTRWVARSIAPGNGNTFGLGVIGIHARGGVERTMSVLWLNGKRIQVGRLARRCWADHAVQAVEQLLPREAPAGDDGGETESFSEFSDDDEEEDNDDACEDGHTDWICGYVGSNVPRDSAGLTYDPLEGSLELVLPRFHERLAAKGCRVSHELLAAGSGWRWHVAVVVNIRGVGCSISRQL